MKLQRQIQIKLSPFPVSPDDPVGLYWKGEKMGDVSLDFANWIMKLESDYVTLLTEEIFEQQKIIVDKEGEQINVK
jgi:hypothetical protein